MGNQSNIEVIGEVVSCFTEVLKQDGSIFSCGNGGSMADAMHFAEELTGRFKQDRRPLSAISISDPCHISCTANDYGYEYIFSRYIEGVAKTGDALLLISTSGNSPNVIAAAKAAKTKQMKVVGLLGNDGGKLKNLVDYPLIVPWPTSDRIQEVHIKLIHIIIECIEKNLFQG